MRKRSHHRGHSSRLQAETASLALTRPVAALAILAAGLLALALGGCSALGDGESMLTTLTVQGPASEKYFPSDEPYHLGAEHFNRGQYGLAEQYFRTAVEKAPEDGFAWIALAASYDRLRRFDLADQAYQRAIGICGETVQILNNQGYSQMLRGNLRGAREKFLKALALEPNNPTILNNIVLLDGSHRYAALGPEQAAPQ